MNVIDKVKIEGFWTDKTVELNLKKDVNFLIGVNGSGKTTIINLIAATLNANFSTLDRIQFKKIKIDLKKQNGDNDTKDAFIVVEKVEKEASPYSYIKFKIKDYNDNEPNAFNLDELEEERLIRYTSEYSVQRKHTRSDNFEKHINLALQKLVNVTWLSINRTSPYTPDTPYIHRRRDERGFESTIDPAIIEELQSELIRYFSQLDRKSSEKTALFQKYIFESLIGSSEQGNTLSFLKDLNIEQDKKSLKDIFLHFGLDEIVTNKKLDTHFQGYTNSLSKYKNHDVMNIDDLSFLIDTRRIHSVVQEWNLLIKKQNKINEHKNTFLSVINSLLQRKKLVINDKNELEVKTESGKMFPLVNLSSGEKQLLIILGQSLLQESKTHIYIADEPELSLHVEWQEKIVSSLRKMNPNSQILFATHSPDIVGEFASSVIKVEEVIS
jgi:predicted ATPase